MSNLSSPPLRPIVKPFEKAAQLFVNQFDEDDLDVNCKTVVYFLEAEGLDLVKIGHTTKDLFAARMSNIQACSPVKLTLLTKIHGDRHLEFGFHRLFHALRKHNEWFELSPAMRGFINVIDGVSARLCDKHRITIDPIPPERAIGAHIRCGEAAIRTMIRKRRKAEAHAVKVEHATHVDATLSRIF